MAIDYKEGDVVVCVNAAAAGAGFDPPPLQHGALYTVQEFDRIPPGWPSSGALTVRVAEAADRYDHGFLAHRFRKAFTPDAEVSRELMAPIPAKPKKVRA